jgi:hypothetical protein
MSQNYKTISIPAKIGTAPGVVNVPELGSVFRCITAGGTFRVQPDNQGSLTMSSGRGFGNPGAAPFRRLSFFNDTAAAIAVTYYAGTEAFELTDAGTVQVTVNPDTATTVTPAGFLVLAGDYGSGTQTSITQDATLFAQKVWLYPASAVSGGVPAANTGDMHVGLSSTCQPRTLTPTDLDVPIYYEAPVGTKIALSAIWMRAETIGTDGLWVEYIP